MTIILLSVHRIEFDGINDISTEYETVKFLLELLQEKRYDLQVLPESVLNDQKLVKSKFYQLLHTALFECFFNDSGNDNNKVSSFYCNVISMIHYSTSKNIFHKFNKEENEESKNDDCRDNDSRDDDNTSKLEEPKLCRIVAIYDCANIAEVQKDISSQHEKKQKRTYENNEIKISYDFAFYGLLLVLELYQLFLAQKMLIYILRELISLQGVAAWCAEYWYWAVHHEHHSSIHSALTSWPSLKSCLHCLRNRFDCKPWFRRCHLAAHYHIKELKREFYQIVSQIGIVYSILQHVNKNISFLQNQCEEWDMNAEDLFKVAQTLESCRYGRTCQAAREGRKDKDENMANISSYGLNFSEKDKANVNKNVNSIHLIIKNVLEFVNNLLHDVALRLSTQGRFTTEFRNVDNTSLFWHANSVILRNECEHSHFFSDHLSPLLHPSMYLNNFILKQNDQHVVPKQEERLLANTKDSAIITTITTNTSTTNNDNNLEKINNYDHFTNIVNENTKEMSCEHGVPEMDKQKHIYDIGNTNDAIKSNEFTSLTNDINHNYYCSNKSRSCEFASDENGRDFNCTSKVENDINKPLYDYLFHELTNTTDELEECTRNTNFYLANKYMELRSSHHPPRARHLVRYVLAASIITPVLAWLSLTPLEEIAALMQRSVALTKLWTKEYLIQPLWQIKESLFHIRRITTAQQESFDKDVQALANIIGDYHGDYEPSKAGVALDAIRHTSYKRLREGIPDEEGYGFVHSHYRNAVRHPLFNTFFGHLPRILLIQHSYQALEISRVINGIDAVLESNDLNFKVMALIPVFLVGALCLTWVSAKWEAHYTPVKHRMKRLWRALYRLFSSSVHDMQETVLDDLRKTHLPVHKSFGDYTRTDETHRASNNDNNDNIVDRSADHSDANFAEKDENINSLLPQKVYSLHEYSNAQTQNNIIFSDICKIASITADEHDEMEGKNRGAVNPEHSSDKVNSCLRRNLQWQKQQQQQEEQHQYEEEKLHFVSHAEQSLSFPCESLEHHELDKKITNNWETSKGWNINFVRRDSHSNCAETDFEVGLTLLLVHIMRSMTHRYFRHYTFAPELTEDLNDLERMELSRADKLCVIQRMYMMHDFLK